MKKAFISFLFFVSAISIFLPSKIYCSFQDSKCVTVKYPLLDPEIERIEYFFLDGQWYQITYYADGSVGITGIAKPPED